ERDRGACHPGQHRRPVGKCFQFRAAPFLLEVAAAFSISGHGELWISDAVHGHCVRSARSRTATFDRNFHLPESENEAASCSIHQDCPAPSVPICNGGLTRE